MHLDEMKLARDRRLPAHMHMHTHWASSIYEYVLSYAGYLSVALEHSARELTFLFFLPRFFAKASTSHDVR